MRDVRPGPGDNIVRRQEHGQLDDEADDQQHRQAPPATQEQHDRDARRHSYDTKGIREQGEILGDRIPPCGPMTGEPSIDVVIPPPDLTMGQNMGEHQAGGNQRSDQNQIADAEGNEPGHGWSRPVEARECSSRPSGGLRTRIQQQSIRRAGGAEATIRPGAHLALWVTQIPFEKGPMSDAVPLARSHRSPLAAPTDCQTVLPRSTHRQQTQPDGRALPLAWDPRVSIQFRGQAVVHSSRDCGESPDRSGQDPALAAWFLTSDERRNAATAIRPYTTGNLVVALVHGRAYFHRLFAVLSGLQVGDELAIAAFRVDGDELLAGPGSSVAEVFAAAAGRGVGVRGLVWRSQPRIAEQSEPENADFTRSVQAAGGDILLDARTRRGGSHHQKLLILRHAGDASTDVAFLGGIDLARGRGDDERHQGDEQAMAFPEVFGSTPPWHDVQVEISGPAVTDVALTFRERWEGSTALDLPSPFRMLWDRAYHAGAMTGRPLPPALPDPPEAGPHAVQVLRTYPARWRRYPFAPLGERSIAAAYRKVLCRARRLIYIEDQYLWAPGIAALLARALAADPGLHLVAVVPRWPDKQGRAAIPSLLGRERAIDICRRAGQERFAVYDVENHDGVAVYVHSKVVIVDDVWAMVGSDNMNRRSWTHDSELACAVLDATPDRREPTDPGGLGDNAREFARSLRLDLWREHLDRPQGGSQDAELLDPVAGFAALAVSASALDNWYADKCVGPRPPGRLRAHTPDRVRRRDKLWAAPVSKLLYDPDGRAIRDRLRNRS